MTAMLRLAVVVASILIVSDACPSNTYDISSCAPGVALCTTVVCTTAVKPAKPAKYPATAGLSWNYFIRFSIVLSSVLLTLGIEGLVAHFRDPDSQLIFFSVHANVAAIGFFSLIYLIFNPDFTTGALPMQLTQMFGNSYGPGLCSALSSFCVMWFLLVKSIENPSPTPLEATVTKKTIIASAIGWVLIWITDASAISMVPDMVMVVNIITVCVVGLCIWMTLTMYFNFRILRSLNKIASASPPSATLAAAIMKFKKFMLIATVAGLLYIVEFALRLSGTMGGFDPQARIGAEVFFLLSRFGLVIGLSLLVGVAKKTGKTNGRNASKTGVSKTKGSIGRSSTIAVKKSSTASKMNKVAPQPAPQPAAA